MKTYRNLDELNASIKLFLIRMEFKKHLNEIKLSNILEKIRKEKGSKFRENDPWDEENWEE